MIRSAPHRDSTCEGVGEDLLLAASEEQANLWREEMQHAVEDGDDENQSRLVFGGHLLAFLSASGSRRYEHKRGEQPHQQRLGHYVSPRRDWLYLNVSHIGNVLRLPRIWSSFAIGIRCRATIDCRRWAKLTLFPRL